MSHSSADQHGLHLAEAAAHKPNKGWRACWGKLHCFPSSSRRRDRHRHHLLPTASNATNPSTDANLQISETAASASSLSPLVHAPPSSPASLSYADNLPSPAALLTLFPLKSVDDLCSSATARGDSSFRGLDPVLVTPPLHSALTTEPTTPLSTAPFTPPPELAHLTTPPSPEVPFAELVASSLSSKCGERISEQTTAETSAVSANVELGNQVVSGNPITTTEARDTEFPSPLVERVPSSQDDAGSSSITLLLQRASPFGFNQVTSADAYGHCSPELIYHHAPHNEENQHVQAENVLLELHSDAQSKEEHLQNLNPILAANENFQLRSEEEQPVHAVKNGNQSRKNEIPELLSANCAQILDKKIEDGPAFFSRKNMSESTNDRQSGDWKRGPASNTNQPSISAIRCYVERHMDGTESMEKCSTCGVLTSKCRALSEALHETKKKLSLIEEKENMIDDREKKYKQILEWLQLEAKSQQASITRLAEELSWQDAAFLDLQAKYLAELGIELPAVCRDLQNTEF